MVIRKQYDIKELGNKVQEAIESCVAGKSNRCSIDLLTANDILEVLRETKVREERHQTLESALSFVENEDGTQTNEMEGEMNKEIPRIIKEHVCFGKYDKDSLECGICDCKYECKEKYEEYFKKKTPERKRPSCFKHFYDNNKQCDNTECVHRKECRIETK